MPTSRKLSKERTRARLLQATLKVLHGDGAAALTTGRIAEAAGVAQPTFYVHFSGLDDALQAAATTVCDRWQVSLHAARLGVDPALAARDRVRGLLAGHAEVLLEDEKSAELFLRHRRDGSSPLGRTFARFSDKLRQELANDLGLPSGEPGPESVARADLAFGLLLAIVESMLDRRSNSVALVDHATAMILGTHVV